MDNPLPKGFMWQSAIQNAPYIFIIVDCQGTILYINHTVAGLQPPKTIGKKLNEFIEPGYHTVMEKALKTVFEEGKATSYTLQGRGPHGSSSLYESVVSPIKDNGKIIAASLITHDITKQKEAEEQLKESERKFRILTERSVDGIFSLDDKGYYTFVSPAVKRIAGYDVQEVHGKSFIDFIYPDDIPLAVSAFDKLIKTGIIEGLELRIKKKDGTIGYVEINASPIITGGKTKGIQGIVRDIGYRKEAEDAIKSQSILTKAILDSVTESIFLIDKHLNIISANATAAQRLNKVPEDLIGKSGLLFISPGITKSRKKYVETAIKTGEPQRFEDVRDSQWFDAHIYPVKDGEGNVDKIAIFARDITQEKEQEIQLKENERKYRTIFESSPEGIVLLDNQGTFIDINGRLFDWVGYRPEDVIGRHIKDQPLFSSETKKILVKKFRERLQNKNIPPYEIEILARDGHVLTGLVHGSLMYDENGNIVGDLVMISDISQRKALEKKIFEQEKMAALGRIASVVSHELNTPLTNISLAAEMLSSHISPQNKEDLDIIKSEVEQASDIITRVLDFSRTDDLQYSTLDLGEIIHEATNLVQRQANSQNVTINIPASFSLPMQGDRNRIREVFINILKNALEAADPQKKDHVISINGHIKDSTVVVTITDTGIGVKTESLDKLTDAFFTTKPLAEGTGLGLTIAQWIIRQHGGTLSISSIPQKGTTVTVSLPSKN